MKYILNDRNFPVLYKCQISTTLPLFTILPTFLVLADCYQILTGNNGAIDSPNYPDDYDSSSTCYWLIRVGNGAVVNLTFYTFQVESRHDVVSVYDGSTTSSRLLLAASNNFTTYPVVPPPVISSTNEMLVVFTTNGVIEMQGFIALYKSVVNF